MTARCTRSHCTSVPVALLIAASEWSNRRKKRREDAARAEANRAEAEAYFARVNATGGVETPAPANCCTPSSTSVTLKSMTRA